VAVRFDASTSLRNDDHGISEIVPNGALMAAVKGDFQALDQLLEFLGSNRLLRFVLHGFLP